jgi:hypothetical protein
VTGAQDVVELERFVVTRRDDITGALAEPPAGFPPPLRDPICLSENGELIATFSTTWGTLHIDNLFLTGSGTLDLASPALPPLAFGLIGAKAGFSPETQGGQVVLGAQVLGAGFLVVIVDLPAFPEVGTSTVGAFPQGTVFYVEPGGAGQLIGLLSGTLELEAVEATNGAEVRGRLVTSLWTGR